MIKKYKYLLQRVNSWESQLINAMTRVRDIDMLLKRLDSQNKLVQQLESRLTQVEKNLFEAGIYEGVDISDVKTIKEEINPFSMTGLLGLGYTTETKYLVNKVHSKEKK